MQQKITFILFWFSPCKASFTPSTITIDNDKDIVLKIILNIKE